MKMTIGFRAKINLIGILILLLITVRMPLIQAQSGDCGNGMAWQLSIGDTGQALTTSRIYSAPEGDVMARLSEGSTFVVSDGPECTSDGRSWWLIETGDGVSGWIFEAAEGSYRLEPITSGEGMEVACGADSILEVGKLATVIDANVMLQLVRISEEDGLIPNPNPLEIDDGADLLVVEGPRCLDGNVLWRVRYPYLPGRELPGVDEILGSQRRYSPLWVTEAVGDTAVLALNPTDYAFDPTYQIEPTLLTKPSSAPIVNAVFQLDFSMGGGGTPIFTDSDFCYLYEGNAVAYYGEVNCILQVFPETVNSVTVRLFQPDGDLFSEDHYELAQILGDRELQVLVPTDFDLPGGLWTAEFIANDVTFTQAYVLDYRRNTEPFMLAACDESTPVLLLSGFPPNTEVQLFLIERIVSDENEYYAEALFDWRIQTDELGNAFGRVNLDLVGGSYAFTYENVTRDGVVYPWECYAGFTFEDAPSLQYGDWITGALGEGRTYFYQFVGQAGDNVTISLISASPDNDPILQLLDEQGEVIAENDDAQVLLYGELDSSMEDFQLPSAGIYFISVSTINPTNNFDYILILENN